MAANKGGESKQGLIISLVITILLLIIVGVVAYYGYDGQAVLAKKADDAAKETAVAKKLRDGWKYRALIMQYLNGQLKEGAELTDYTSIRSSTSIDVDNKAAFDAVVAKLEARLVKDGGKKEFESFTDKVDRLEKELTDTRALLVQERDSLGKARATIAKKEQEHQELVASLLDKHSKDLQAERDKYTAIEKNLQDKLNEFGDLTKTLTDNKKLSEAEKAALQKTITSMKGELVSQGIKRQKLEDKLKPPDLFRFDVPKGKIIRLDPKGELAWVDIGSSDNLKSHEALTFALFGSTAGARAGGERKGALEIVDVIGAHLSMAKITDVTDPNSNPIMPGDLLINPAWSPTNRTHVALAGLFDLTGEGRDQIGEFKRQLEKEGVIVDAYLDLRDQTVKGDGMSIKTDYLVLGEQPGFDEKQSIKAGDKRVDRKGDILDKIAEMKSQADKLGATTVPFRRFVLLTGYKLPKAVGVSTGVGYDFIRPSDTLTDKPAKRGDKPAPKPEKKDDEEKDKEKDKDKDK